LPQTEAEADRQDREAFSKAHAAWLSNGKQPPKPQLSHVRLQAAQRRMVELLDREIPLANLAVHEARLGLLQYRLFEHDKAAQADLDALASKDAEIEQLQAERAEIQNRVRRNDGKKRSLKTEYYKALNKVNDIRNRFKKLGRKV